MTAQLIDGKAVAKTIEAEVAEAIARLGFSPGLVAVRVGNDPASEVYVRSKAKKARELGLRGDELILPESTSEADLLAHIDRLNGDDAVDGILVQLPVPAQIDAKKVIDAIADQPLVDGAVIRLRAVQEDRAGDVDRQTTREGDSQNGD